MYVRAPASAEVRFILLTVARKHADSTDAAIKALALDGMNATEIWRRLKAGTAGLEKPIEMHLRTVQHKAQLAKRAAGWDEDPLRNRDEVETADAILRDFLRTGLAEAKRYRELAKAGKLGTQELSRMREDAKLISEIRRHFAKLKVSPRSTGNQGAAGEEKGRQAKPASTLERLSTHLDTTRPGADASQSTSEAERNGRDAGEAEASDESSEDDASHSVPRASTNHA